MAANRSDQLQAIVRNGIAPLLTLQELSRVIRVSKHYYQLFGPTFQERKISTLIYAVIEADHQNAAAIVKIDPTLMFQSFILDTRYSNGEVISKRTTPLKLAFELLDTYMWRKIFWEAIKKKSIFVTQFYIQKEEQKEYVNLNPLFAAYNEFIKQYQRRIQSLILDSDVIIAGLNIGMVMRERLPRHMLKRFCQKELSWNIQAEFNIETDSHYEPCKIRHNNTDSYDPLWPFPPNAGLGYKFLLIRNESNAIIPVWKSYIPLQATLCKQAATRDAEVFRRLWEIRVNELLKGPLPLENPKHKKKKNQR